MRNIPLALLLAASVSGCVDGLDSDTTDPDTSTVESYASVYQWSNDIKTGARSGYQPGLAAFGGRLHMLATNMDGQPVGALGGPLHWQRFNGVSWGAPVATSQYADYGPSVAVFNNRLTAVYHARGQNRLVMTTSDGTNGWTTPVNAGTTLNSTTLRYAPSIAARGGALFAAYCTHDAAGDHIRLDRFATSWSTVKQFDMSGSGICKHVALALEPDNHFRMLYTVEYGPSVWGFYETRDNGTDAVTWSAPRLLPMNSKKPPSMVTCNNVTHMVHGGYSSPSEIWWSDREGGDWIDDQKVPGQTSDGGAALGCLGTRAIMVHNGGYDDMWWSEFLP